MKINLLDLRIYLRSFLFLGAICYYFFDIPIYVKNWKNPIVFLYRNIYFKLL